MSITDEDINAFLDRPTIAERAKAAAEMERARRLAVLEERVAGEQWELRHNAELMMRDMLGMTEGDIADVKFHFPMHGEHAVCLFSVECFDFRFAFGNTVVGSFNQNGSTQTLRDWVIERTAKSKNSSTYRSFKTLAELGSFLGDALPVVHENE